MSALSPGLYRATVRGVADVIMLVDQNGMGHHDLLEKPDDGVGTTHSHDEVVHNARPLIVLDLADYDAGYVIEVLRHPHHLWANRVADQIEAQTKPARIPEPGVYGVVEATRNRNPRDTWLRTRNGWSNGYFCRPWSDLIDPTLIREGVES